MTTRQAPEKLRTEGNTLTGYAIVYNVDSVLINERGKTFTEQIARGAFESIKDDDIKLYFNHQSGMPLARTENGSLRLKSDQKGVYFEADLPNTTLGNDVKELLNRGVLTGEMSFGFVPTEETWTAKDRKTVERGRLYEVSIVVDAAYEQTSSQLRGIMQEINQKRINLLRRKTV
jgi:HK97 family phage prohead protease